jgi:hypothetical protein
MDPKTMLRFAFKDDLALLILLDGNSKPVVQDEDTDVEMAGHQGGRGGRGGGCIE